MERQNLPAPPIKKNKRTRRFNPYLMPLAFLGSALVLTILGAFIHQLWNKSEFIALITSLVSTSAALAQSKE